MPSSASAAPGGKNGEDAAGRAGSSAIERYSTHMLCGGSGEHVHALDEPGTQMDVSFEPDSDL